MKVTVRNVITSMRLISWFDWAQFVESVSLVDEVLGARGLFAEMDFATRDRYRHVVEELARGSGLTEVDVARTAVAMADAAPSAEDVDPSIAARRGDPGYYLISDGHAALERRLKVRVPLGGRLRRAYVRAATRGYVATIALVTLLLLAVPLLLSGAGGLTAGVVVIALLALGPASDLAVALVNRAIVGVMGPRPLPRLELTDGVPTEMRTLVVVPTLLSTEAEVEAQVGGLEVHYLGEPGRRPPVRPAVRLARRPDRAGTRRRRAPVGVPSPPSTGSTSVTARLPAAAPGSCCSTASGRGTRRKAAGWAGSASAASSRSSTRSCVARRRPAS